MKRIILIHGAAHGAWCWELVVPLLRARGFSAEAIDLPGSGDDMTPPEAVTLERCVERIVRQLDSGEGPATLVGHSLGGTMIAAAGEAAPERVSRLVFLTAMVPRHGETTGDTSARARRDAGLPEVSAGWRRAGPHSVEHADPLWAFYNRTPPDLAALAIARLRPQPAAPMAARLGLTAARFGRLPKSFVFTRYDQVLPFAAQQAMRADWPDMRTQVLETDHSAFFTDPEGVAAALATEADAD